MKSRQHAQPAVGGLTNADFFSLLSHRLRTPLAAISAWTAVLQSAAAEDPAKVARAAAIIEANARKEAALIAICIDAMGVLSANAAPERSPVSMVGVVFGAVRAVRTTDEAWNIDVSCDDPDDRYWVRGDRRRLGLMVSLLIEQVVESTTDTDAAVDITVRQESPWIMLEIEGATRRPLSAEEHDVLETSELRLAIVEQILELHEGRFERSSYTNAPGEVVHRWAAMIPAGGAGPT